ALGKGDREGSGLSLFILVFQFLGIISGLIFRSRIDSNIYDFFYKLYMLLTSLYFLFLNVSFSDRFGVFSWILLPIIIVYPLTIALNRNVLHFVIISLLYLILS